MARVKGDASATERQISEILKASTLVFGKYGYNGGSLSQIAKHLDIGESGILHHFKTKANLLAAVLKYRDQQGIERSGLQGSDGIDFIKSWLSMIQFNMSDPGNVELYCIISAEATSTNHPAHDYFQARYETITGFALEAFKALTNLGYLNEGQDSNILAQTLVALSDGLQVQWLLNPSSDMLGPHKEFFSRILTQEGAELAGLRASRHSVS